MIDTLKKYLDKLVTYLKPREVQPLTAENAQSLSYYKKVMNYEDMVSEFKREIFRKIETKSYYGNNYITITIPEWLESSTYTDIIKGLIALNYKTHIIKELRLLIIYWK